MDQSEECDIVWKDISRAFTIDDERIKESIRHSNIGGLSIDTVKFIIDNDIGYEILEYLQTELEIKLRKHIVPNFWKWFHKQADIKSYTNEDVPIQRSNSANEFDRNDDTFIHAVKELYNTVTKCIIYVQRLDQLAAYFQKNATSRCENNFLPKITNFGAESYLELFFLTLKGVLHSQLPPPNVFLPPIESFYARAFQVYHIRQAKDPLHQSSTTYPSSTPNKSFIGYDNSALMRDDSSTCSNSSMNQDLEERCEGCLKMSTGDGCECNSIIAVFHEVNRALIEMDLLERISSDVVTKIVRSKIELHVDETCQGTFTRSHVASLEEWLDKVVMGWIKLLYSSSPGLSKLKTENDSNLSLLVSFRQRMCHYLYEVYTRAMIDQLFNIIIEFPESQPALEDLRECLLKTDLRGHLTRSLKGVLQKKLQHLGVNTTDILSGYIAAIRALRVLDPSGVLLEQVCEPVRRYLRTRDDTVRCIVQSLTDESNTELAEELTKNEGLCLDDSMLNEFGDGGYHDPDPEELEATWETWQPDPIETEIPFYNNRNSTTRQVGTCSQSRRRKTSDIISMLVNIYGSKELFVNEYRSLLSNRLLSQFSYDTEKEIRNLELLKLRFGEAPLHQCEVMLKDIGDSKRIDSLLYANKEKAEANQNSEDVENIQSKGATFLRDSDFPVHSIILSAQFWPQFTAMEKLQLPDEVMKSLEGYTKGFEAMKGNRTLVWKTHLGFANIDLEIGKEKRNMTVTPVQAAIIYHFQEKAEWTAEELSQTLKIPVSTLRRRISFWQAQGLIKEVATDKYALIEEGMVEVDQGDGIAAEDEEAESVTKSTKSQRAEELEMFWTYITNMLINFESLTLDRIYQMLKMFAMQPGANNLECSMEELRSFLDSKVRQHELLFSKTSKSFLLPKV